MHTQVGVQLDALGERAQQFVDPIDDAGHGKASRNVSTVSSMSIEVAPRLQLAAADRRLLRIDANLGHQVMADLALDRERSGQIDVVGMCPEIRRVRLATPARRAAALPPAPPTTARQSFRVRARKRARAATGGIAHENGEAYVVSFTVQRFWFGGCVGRASTRKVGNATGRLSAAPCAAHRFVRLEAVAHALLDDADEAQPAGRRVDRVELHHVGLAVGGAGAAMVVSGTGVPLATPRPS